MSAADLCLALALSALLSVVVAAAQYMRAEKAEAEVARLTAERDALAAAHARESKKVWKVEEVMDDIEGSDPTTWERLRDALAGSEADTSERETQHVMREPSMTDLRWTCSGCEWARSDAFTTAEERADSFATEHQPTDQEGK